MLGVKILNLDPDQKDVQGIDKIYLIKNNIIYIFLLYCFVHKS